MVGKITTIFHFYMNLPVDYFNVKINFMEMHTTFMVYVYGIKTKN